MRGKWMAVLALTAMLAGCGTAAPRPAAQTTGPAAATRAPAGSRAAAVTLAGQMLSGLVVPAGSQAARPSPVPPQLSLSSAGSAGPYTVELHRFVLVREPAVRVHSFLLAHVPARMSWAGLGLAPGTTNTVTVLWVAYRPRSLASGLADAELGTAALPSAGGTLIRADASVSWFPPRSAAEQLNAASFGSVTVTATGVIPQPRTVTRTFTSPAVIGRLVALVDSLPATPYPDTAGVSCVGVATVYRLDFIPGVIVGNAGGCGGSDAITVNGKEQPRLWDQGALTAAARQLLHLTAPGPRPRKCETRDTCLSCCYVSGS